MPLVLATDDDGGPEIFASVQGEGPSMGVPCTFVRLSRCNLACIWCDTAYTWHFTGDERPHRDGRTYERKPNQFTLEEEDVADRVTALAPRRLVLTGGEPTLQAPALAKMLSQLDGFGVEIETNGTSPPYPALDPLIDQYNVSPKLSHSGNPAELALVPERLRHWAQEPRAFFKFVISTPVDVAEVDALVSEYGIEPGRVFLMPEGTDSATLREREIWLTPLCIERGYRLSDRLHIHLFGDTRGT
ncbi:7-carboxy-7-deazaguanine synthase QueE [Pseudoblastomonas halimionae]|uniref:7-carboxy-7-deazaguanine synthase n=1 Tax=Alteriqipengyuania halimionae TaxID=1926630 RepID=A0A6I4U3C1_9SPHN|nr:7-carboxy-7-deazaguanine synthase QueE [Alteriqipengyuania halimionae]MXP10226.1 radical SAM protein [Alteriqipengyuania halimionae]